MALDKNRKKELLKQYKEREIGEARRKMFLHPDQLRELHSYLALTIEELGIPCDHTLSRTREWAVREGLVVDEVLRSVREFGGYCDCEVMKQIAPKWRAKFGDD